MLARQGCLLVSAMMALIFLSGCASGRKQKFEMREKLAASSGLYCDFVNGDKNKEVELELNLLMSKKCDADRPFSITNYKTPAEVTGVLYCCAIKKEKDDFKAFETSKPEPVKSFTPVAPAPAPKSEAKPVEPVKPQPVAPVAKPEPPAKTPAPAPAKSPEKKELDGDVSL